MLWTIHASSELEDMEDEEDTESDFGMSDEEEQNGFHVVEVEDN